MTRSLPAGLLETVLAEAFPFHLLVDADGRATEVGPSLRLVCPALVPGVEVQEHLTVTTPRGAGWQRGDGVAAPSGLVLLSGVGTPLVLRGQLLAAGAGLLFVGSPWVTSLPALSSLGLRLDHFAAADPVTDLLMLLSAQTSALGDAQLLADQLTKAGAEQAHQANHDGLTGLANRSHFSVRLDEALRRAEVDGGSVAVVLLDLDRFKEINDTLGHHFGDRLLQQIGPRIRSVLRAGEVVARLGGDEFALLLSSPGRGPGTLPDHQRAARRVLDAIHEPFVVDGLTLVVEVSAGIAMAPEHGTTGQLIMQHADVAMYLAKTDHVRVRVYSQDLDSHNPRRLALLSELRSALEQGDLRLHYQPLLDLATDRVLGAEALVRWQHGTEGLLSPSDFVPLAESSGLIHELTSAVLTLACAQAAAWAAGGQPLVVSVNISARCLMDATLPETVGEHLARAGLPARLLKLEITESAIIADQERALSVLARLRALGVALSVDDFGTGYTSLAHLRELPVQELKIDRSFVTGMLRERKNAVIVQTAVELASRLGLCSVAEGVEDGRTLVALRALGCSTAQGYHVSRPLPPERFLAWLTEWDAAHPAAVQPVGRASAAVAGR